MFFKKVFLKSWQISQENTCVVVSFLIKLKKTPTKAFPVKYAKVLGTLFLKNICERICLENRKRRIEDTVK